MDEPNAIAPVVAIIDDACHRAREYPYTSLRGALADLQIHAHDQLRQAAAMTSPDAMRDRPSGAPD